MLSKNDFIKSCGNSIEDADKLFSLYVSALKSEKTMITNEFYTVNVCNVLKSFLSTKELNVSCYGFVDDAERCLIAFSMGEIDLSIFDDVAKVLKISYNDKFNKLSHRDFLGSIMSLGFSREKMGDLVIENNSVYVPVVIGFVDYIIQNLTKVKHSSVNVAVELFNRLPQKRFEILYKVVSSLRVDNIISSLTNISRERSKLLVKEGKIKINGIIESNPDKKICENDIIVVTGFGKFKFKEILGSTSKNKNKIIVDKFI